MIQHKHHPDQVFGCLSYAQHGDDFMLLNLFKLIGVDRPSYLDLGAHHPFTISNTALLYDKGSRGVNVEANPNLIAEFQKHRPQDTNVNVGVGLQSGVFPFYMYSNSCGRNTFSSDEVKSLEGKTTMTVKKVIELPVLTLTEILDTYCGGRFPDLLLTDIEGMDFAVVSSADFSRSSPKVIVSEVRRGDSANIKSFLSEHGYFCYCRMGENLFFVHSDFGYLVY